MEKTTRDATLDNAPEKSDELLQEIRTLVDQELLLVGGGGDEPPNW